MSVYEDSLPVPATEDNYFKICCHINILYNIYPCIYIYIICLTDILLLILFSACGKVCSSFKCKWAYFDNVKGKCVHIPMQKSRRMCMRNVVVNAFTSGTECQDLCLPKVS